MFSHRRRLIAALVLAVAAVAWLLVNHPVEGRTLLVVTPNHGVTEADLPSLALLVVAGLLVLSVLRAQRRRPGR